MTSINEALQYGQTQLASFEEAKLESEVLLQHATGQNRTWLYTWPEKDLMEAQWAQYQRLIAERKTGKPLAYITGIRSFWTFELKVSEATLIPRPDTETLVQAALDHIPDDVHWRIADLGTGSGAIALAIAAERPLCTVLGVDLSTAALKIAENNRQKYDLGNVHLQQSHWLKALQGRFNVIVSNPPYIAEDDPHLQQGDLTWEPASALSASDRGLADIATIIKQSRDYLTPDGWLLLEHGWDQKQAVADLLHHCGYNKIQCLQDIAGLDRVSLAQIDHYPADSSPAQD